MSSGVERGGAEEECEMLARPVPAVRFRVASGALELATPGLSHMSIWS